jgi:hypothetical protein
MASLPTVLVAAPGGGSMLINLSDFDSLVHQKYDEFLSDAASVAARKASFDRANGVSPSFDTAVSDSLATATGFTPPAMETAAVTSIEVSPLEARVTRLIEAYTLIELRENAKAYGLKGLSRVNERAVAEAIAAHELKLEANHASD